MPTEPKTFTILPFAGKARRPRILLNTAAGNGPKHTSQEKHPDQKNEGFSSCQPHNGSLTAVLTLTAKAQERE